jgi:hypothetical protein
MQHTETYFICPRCHVRWEATEGRETPYKVSSYILKLSTVLTSFMKGLVIRGQMWDGAPAVLTESSIDRDFHGLFAPNMAIIEISDDRFEVSGNPASIMKYMLNAYYPESSPNRIVFLFLKLQFDTQDRRSMENYLRLSDIIAENLVAYAVFMFRIMSFLQGIQDEVRKGGGIR